MAPKKSSATNNKSAKKQVVVSASSSKKTVASPLPSKIAKVSSPQSAGKKNSSSPSPSASSKKKSVQIAAPSKNQTTVYNNNNPVTHMTSFVDVDWKKEEAEEKQRLITHRAKHNAIEPKEGAEHNQQAFHPLAIPYVVATENLTVAELKTELSARHLPTRGNREHLVKRLDAYLREFEGHRLQKAVDDEKKILSKRK